LNHSFRTPSFNRRYVLGLGLGALSAVGFRPVLASNEAGAETHGMSVFGGGGSFMPSGWPDSIRVMSGSGPFGPIFAGV